jgi:hypothetical protein
MPLVVENSKEKEEIMSSQPLWIRHLLLQNRGNHVVLGATLIHVFYDVVYIFYL